MRRSFKAAKLMMPRPVPKAWVAVAATDCRHAAFGARVEKALPRASDSSGGGDQKQVVALPMSEAGSAIIV